MTTYGSILTNLREIMMKLLRQRDEDAYWREKWAQYKRSSRSRWRAYKP